MFDLSNPSLLFSSMIWSAIGFGYIIYGRKQRSISAFSGGIGLNVLAYLCNSSLLMSLACVGVMALVFFLVKREG